MKQNSSSTDTVLSNNPDSTTDKNNTSHNKAIDNHTDMNDDAGSVATLHSNNKTLPTSKSTTYQNSKWFKYLYGDIYATDDPNQYSQKKKNVIIFLVALGGLCGPLSSMMYMPGILAVAQDLNTSISAVNGTISAYVVFMGISPLFWAALSDAYGRKRMYLISGLINVICSIISAQSANIGMLVAFRAIQSFGANAGLTLGAGVIADSIAVEVRGRAYGFFYIGPLVGPVIGPTIGGFLCQYLGWRSTFYFSAILAGVLLILTAAFLPETLRKKRQVEAVQDELNKVGADVSKGQHVAASKSTLQSDSSTTLASSSQRHSFWDTIVINFRPMVIMLYDPNVLLLILYNTVIFACLYFLNPTITDTFKRIYGYTEWEIGLCYLSLGAGFMIGSIFSGQHSDYILRKLSKKNTSGKKIVSEMRLQAAVPSFFLIPAGYLIYGWTTEKRTGVYAPLIGLFVYALGQMWAFTPTSVYLVDSKPGYSATAVGINSCIRCIVAAITTLFSSTAVDALGTGVLFTILAAVNVVNIISILLCYFYGTKWRVAFEKKHMPELLVLNDSLSQEDVNSEKVDDLENGNTKDDLNRTLSENNNMNVCRIDTHQSSIHYVVC